MGILAFAAPVGFVIFGFALLYLAYSYRKINQFGFFEFFFGVAILLVTGALYLIYQQLQFAGGNLASTIYPIFVVSMWLFVLIFGMTAFKLIKFVMDSIYAAYKTRR